VRKCGQNFASWLIGKIIGIEVAAIFGIDEISFVSGIFDDGWRTFDSSNMEMPMRAGLGR
jgi:hypothetical protein